MRLVDLNPTWQRWFHEKDIPFGQPPTWHAIGMSFDCPVHRTHRVHVDFAVPFDDVKPVPRIHLWQRTGDTFETLTLAPSVDYTRYDNGELRDPTCWHGFVQNGNVT